MRPAAAASARMPRPTSSGSSRSARTSSAIITRRTRSWALRGWRRYRQPRRRAGSAPRDGRAARPGRPAAPAARLCWGLSRLSPWAPGRVALTPQVDTRGMPERVVPPPQHPFIVMNPRSGGGKVGRFDLKDKAEALGAEVVLLEGPEQSTSPRSPADAVARGADLLGVAGGDGTQALVAGVAAEHDVPFLVISAGTRNHFALDLGLDREDPSDLPRGADRGRRRAARRPRHDRGPDVREQRVLRGLRRDGAEPGLPGRQDRHHARRCCPTCSAGTAAAA